MEYWYSAEVEQAVLSALNETEMVLTSVLISEFKSGILGDISMELSYIPIVMGPDFVEFYPARSSYSRTDNKVFHSPQLDFEIFRYGTSGERERAYIEGLLLAKPLLRQAGLDEIQTAEFESKLHRLLVQ
mgnify:CR=1 FL=1